MEADSVVEVLRRQASALKDKRDAVVRQYNQAIAVVEEAISKLGTGELAAQQAPYAQGVNPQGGPAEQSNAEFIRVLYEHGDVSQRSMRKHSSRFKSAGGVYSTELRLVGAGLIARVGKEGRSPIYGLTSEGRRVAEQVFGSPQVAGERPVEPLSEPEPEATVEGRITRPVATTPKRKRKRAARRKVDLHAVRRRIMEYVSENPRVRPADVKKALAETGENIASEPTVRRQINELVQRGLLARNIIEPRHHQLMVRVHGEFGQTIRPGEPTDASRGPAPEPEAHSDPRPAWAR